MYPYYRGSYQGQDQRFFGFGLFGWPLVGGLVGGLLGGALAAPLFYRPFYGGFGYPGFGGYPGPGFGGYPYYY